MRKILFALLVLSVIACSKDRIKVSGTIQHADTLMLYLDEVDVYESKSIDSVTLNKGGKFRFDFRAESAGFYQLRLSNNKNIVLFPEPDQHIIVEADAENVLSSLKIEGSSSTEQVQNIVKGLSETKIKLDSINELFGNIEADSIKIRLNREYEEILNEQRTLSIAFLLTHYNSLACLYVLYQQYQPGSYVFYKNMDLQYFKIISDSLKKYHPDARHVLALDATTQRLIGDYNTSVIQHLAANKESTLPKLALPNVAGDTISLMSLKDRYVFLYFWSSWSQESLAQNAELIKIYNTFKNKDFEVMAVFLNNSVDVWTKAIKYDELYWTNVIDESFPNSLAAANYNVTTIPCSYLVDKKEVKILAKNLTPAQLQQKLTELLN